MSEYTGFEQPSPWNGESPEPGVAFVVRPPGLPAAAVPLFDDDLQAVVGFRWESATGVYRVYDLDGEFVSMHEEPLQTPLIDPLDLIFIFGGMFRVAARGVSRAATKTAFVGGMRGLVVTLGEGATAALRASLRRLLLSDLKFTSTTVTRMMAQGRHVPVHILKLAIRHGTRAPDPKGIAGAFEYTIPMMRNGVGYTLKIVLREADNTVLHFHYFR